MRSVSPKTTLGLAAALLTAGLLTGINQGRADETQERWYQVEIIVFKYKSNDHISTEKWPDNPGFSDISKSVQLSIPGQDNSGTTPAPEPAPAATPGTEPGQEPAKPEPPTPEAHALTLEKGAAPVAFQVIGRDELTLGKIIGHLKRSSRLNVLLHTGWRQPVVDRNTSRSVIIRTGKLLEYVVQKPAGTPAPAGTAAPAAGSTPVPAEPAGTTGQPTSPTATPAGPQPAATGTSPAGPAPATPAEGTQPAPQPNAPEKKQVYQIQGNIMISRSRYLHIRTDLVYANLAPAPTEPLPATGTPAAPASSPATPAVPGQAAGQPAATGQPAEPQMKMFFYRSKVHRRTRRDEIHYIDHPGFGIIVKVSYFKLPEKKSP